MGQRIFGLAWGYKDLNDRDDLRKDPVFAVLAGKSTLNRLERTPKRHGARYHKIDFDQGKADALLHIVLDLGATDIPLFGNQEGRYFHGYYDN